MVSNRSVKFVSCGKEKPISKIVEFKMVGPSGLMFVLLLTVRSTQFSTFSSVPKNKYNDTWYFERKQVLGIFAAHIHMHTHNINVLGCHHIIFL